MQSFFVLGCQTVVSEILLRSLKLNIFSALKLDLMIKRPEAYLALISFFASN